MNKNLNILVVYGGVSPEHEVAVITAVQAMNALKEEGFGVIPVYISKEGFWYKGDNRYLDPRFYKDLEKVKKAGTSFIIPANRDIHSLSRGWLGFSAVEESFDVVFPVFHGQNGEDGTIQGLLEMANIPYVCGGTLTGSAGMDKFVTKRIAESIGINVTKDFLITKGTYNKKTSQEKAKDLGYPVYVKPANLGSSIGITRVKNASDLSDAIEVAFHYDDRILIEKAVDLEKEINISVLGNNPYEVSITEQPIASGDLLSFEDKYVSNAKKTHGMASLKRLIPAQISKDETKQIQNWAKDIFGAINGKGLARVDFMMDKKGKIYFNEINTIPGALAFFLWEKAGYPFGKLVAKLVDLAIESWKLKQKKTTVFKSNILAGLGKLGTKGKA